MKKFITILALALISWTAAANTNALCEQLHISSSYNSDTFIARIAGVGLNRDSLAPLVLG